MIYTTYNGAKFAIQFRYDEEFDGTRSTQCCIYVLINEMWLDVGRAWAFQNKNDNFCKETGRKIALERALNDSRYDTKDFRTVIWLSYLNRNAGKQQPTNRVCRKHKPHDSAGRLDFIEGVN